MSSYGRRLQVRYGDLSLLFCSAVCQLLLGVVVLEEMLEEGRKSEACMRV